MEKRGLILEGGAMRGIYTAGVIDVCMEEQISFDGLIGVSAGAAFGCNYKSRQPGRAIRYNERFAKDPRYCSLWSLVTTGDLFGARYCYHTLPEKLDVMDAEAFWANPMKFYCVCTEVKTGRAVYHRCERVDEETLEWIRAGASMPLVSRPVKIDGREYLDGGIADSIPLGFMEKHGYEKKVLVLTQPAGYRKKPMKLRRLVRFLLRDYPAVVRQLERRHLVYNRTLDMIDQKERAGSLFVIRPEQILPIGRVEHDPQVMERVYEIGRKQMKGQLDALRRYLGE